MLKMSEKYSERIGTYFNILEEGIKESYDIAKEARIKGFDPENKVDIPLARGISERVEGLISA
ncbi:hypothetical protein C0585_03045, partial [Candidatus Woesearchaeota archaeon]